MNLYEINKAMQECINLETGEIDLELSSDEYYNRRR